MIPRIRAVGGPRIRVPEVVGCCMLLLVGVEDGGLAAVESSRLVEAVGVMGLVMVVVCIQCKEAVAVVVLYKWGLAEVGNGVAEVVNGAVVVENEVMEVAVMSICKVEAVSEVVEGSGVVVEGSEVVVANAAMEVAVMSICKAEAVS
ncbi:hypothetical protein HanIR_Chr12g0563271 [Helianthus annuus]|nr:hypothetical protein HanIR_Chr12g0563271 [Helianthus annuus]